MYLSTQLFMVFKVFTLLSILTISLIIQIQSLSFKFSKRKSVFEQNNIKCKTHIFKVKLGIKGCSEKWKRGRENCGGFLREPWCWWWWGLELDEWPNPWLKSLIEDDLGMARLRWGGERGGCCWKRTPFYLTAHMWLSEGEYCKLWLNKKVYTQEIVSVNAFGNFVVPHSEKV